MSTRLSAEELDAYEAVAPGASGFVGDEVLRFVAEIRESWAESVRLADAARELVDALSTTTVAGPAHVMPSADHLREPYRNLRERLAVFDAGTQG